MEVAGVVLGVLPLIVGTLRAYHSAHGKLYPFRDCSKALKRIQTIFDVRKQIFVNECRLLLQVVLEENVEAKNMVEDMGHGLWHDEEVNSRLVQCLEGNHDLCVTLIKDMRAILDETERDLGCFDVVMTAKSKVCTRLKMTGLS